MIATRQSLLEILPPYRDQWILIDADQTVRDIIDEVLAAHKDFAPHYDLIAFAFDRDTIEEVCSSLYWFCKSEIEYREETDRLQTTAVPAGILSRGYGDCKHYAGFCGGVLDAMNRQGKKINWCYRFASYNLLDSTPHHVFIVVNPGTGNEIWIDATPESKGRTPIYQVDKKVNTMALVRNIAGIGDTGTEVAPVPDVNSITQTELVTALEEIDTDPDIPEEVFSAIATLIRYGLLLEDGSVLIAEMDKIVSELPDPEKLQLINAYNMYVQNATVGSVFKDLWRGVKVVSLSIPRNAFLGLVALNVFGMASKMSKLLAIPDARNKLLDKWYSLGGKASALEGAINSGAKKKAILGSCIAPATVGAAPAAAAPVWLTVAAGIIAAIMPLVTSLLKQNNAYTADFAAIDAGNYNYGVPSGGGFFDSIKNFVVQNPIPSAAAAALLIYLVWQD
jgi:hypothetical protein